MKKLQVSELVAKEGGTIFGNFATGKGITRGGVHVFKPGEVAHGGERHAHEIEEAFIILQGKATLPIDGQTYDLQAGDVVIIEPGEDHHMTGDENEPPVVIWLHIE